MAPSTPTLEDRQSQIIAGDCSTDGTDSDFDGLFSQNTMHMAASGDSHWRAADWHSFSRVEDIEQHQEPAEAILPEIAPEADHREPAEATAADVIPKAAHQKPADATSPEHTSQLAQVVLPDVVGGRQRLRNTLLATDYLQAQR
jgi:hypothetical protein